MDYILSSIFGQTLQKHGLIAALVVVVVFAGISLAAYYAKAKVDGWRTEASAAAAERAQVAQERLREIASKEAERQALIAELRAAREQTFRLMENHLAHDKIEREELARVMSGSREEQRANVETMKSMQVSLEAHRTESRERAGKLYEKIGAVNERLATIEGRLPS